MVLCRNLFAIPALLPLLWQAGGLAALRTPQPGLHASRLAGGLLGMVGAFYGYAVLPLATVTALGFTMPLFLTLLSVPLLRERVGPRRGAAVLAGFGGVLLMTLPGGAGAVTCWACGGAGRGARLGAGDDHHPPHGRCGGGQCRPSCSGSRSVRRWSRGWPAIPGWVWPTPAQWALLAGIGVVSALAQVMMTEGYRRGEATLLAPFEYSAILWTTALGAAVWAELPDGWDFAGIAVLVASGLYIWRREVALGLRR